MNQMKFNSKAYNKDMEIIYDELFANHRNEGYYNHDDDYDILEMEYFYFSIDMKDEYYY